MTPKERFMNVLKFNSVDRIPFIESSVWPQTVERWKKEGMPEDAIINEDFFWGNKYFDLEGFEALEVETRLPYPLKKPVVIKEDNRYIEYIDELYRKRRAIKEGTVKGCWGETRISMDQYLDFPVKDRKTFLLHKKHFEGNYNDRYPKNYEGIKSNFKNSNKPLFLPPWGERFGFYSMLRTWMGTERLSVMFYDDPKLIRDMVEFLTDFILEIIKKAVKEIRFDVFFIHEDLGFKTAPLISPKLFILFLLPSYKKVIEFVKSNNVEFVVVDSDGNFEDLIPIFLEAGVDCFFPMEIAADMDPVRLRKKYGKSFSMMGGVDKRQLIKDKTNIDNELERITPIIQDGGYIPTIDHSIPFDVSYENFKYYLKSKRKIIMG